MGSKRIFNFRTLFITILLSIGQSVQQCNPGSQCILLSFCPRLANLLRVPTRENVLKIRSSICAFKGRRSMVCCPSSVDKESLLPRECGRSSSDDRIVGGTPTPIEAYPWMAALGYTDPSKSTLQFVCAGAVISSRYVLTAAHCLDPEELGRRKLSVIHLGDWDLSKDRDCQLIKNRYFQKEKCNPPHVVVGFEETVNHPMYNKRGRTSDDIALIRLNKAIDFSSDAHSIQPVCLPPKNFDLRKFSGLTPVAAGWGLTEHGNNSNILLRIKVPLANDDLCRERYQSSFVGNQLCVGGANEGVDTCSGDSGGPLVVNSPGGGVWMQIGIVSFGPFPCNLQKFPGVYTEVADYRDWILNNMKF